MIAVFCKNRKEFDRLAFTPKSFFRHIRGTGDVYGRRFVGIIEIDNWWEGSEEMRVACDLLIAMHPELFKNK